MITLKKPIKSQKMDEFNVSELLFEDDAELDLPIAMTNDDMWKKFELLTPPGSPVREDDFNIENMMMQYDVLAPESITIFHDDGNKCPKEITFPESPPPLASNNLRSILIQDPMWSASSGKVADVGPVSEKEKVEKRLRCDSCSGPSYDMNTGDCVDPLSVFQYQINNISETRVHKLGIETPSDSEEEIDVVTVGEKKLQVTFPVKRKYSSMEDEDYKTRVSITESKPVQTQTNKSSIKQKVDCPTNVHNYSLPPKRIRSLPTTPTTKRMKRELSVPDLKRVAQKLKPMSHTHSSSSSRNSSDSEECETGKRTQHNVLERKRRTDLKLSFFHLRDSVPDLQGQERAPKVLILRNAAKHIRKLIDEQNRYEIEIDQLKLRKEQLKRTLMRLREN